MSEADITVEAYSGYRFGERPRAFTWRGRRYEVLAVEQRWRTPEEVAFVVIAISRAEAEGSQERWELTYNEVQDTWHIRRAYIREDR